MTPIIVMNAILLVVTVLLAVADKFLVTYGKCKVVVKKEGEEKEFTVEGGGSLLTALVDNGMKVPASCGGKGSCGYCKVNVSAGGGQILPTEELFVSKEEKAQGTRLACQVKIKNDLQLYIPDLLTTVKAMVKYGTFDTKTKWQFYRDGECSLELASRKYKKLNKEDREKAEEIVARYQGREGVVMSVLRDVSESFHYLPEPVMMFVADQLKVPLSSMYRMATFYHAFNLKPRGKYVIAVCTGTACHVKGSADVLSGLEHELGIKTGETTEDMMFTLEAVRCIGCCGLAPVLKVNNDVHGLLTRRSVPGLIARYRGE